MWESITEVFTETDFFGILIKVLLTAILTGLVGLLGTIIGRTIVKFKNSKIRKYAADCVDAAEQKFPNEGTKMGPEKMQYVMDQLSIKFPKIKDNRFLYNIAEAAVYQLNEDKRREAAIKEFEEKYGEKPLAVQDKESISLDDGTEENSNDSVLNQDNTVEEEINTEQENLIIQPSSQEKIVTSNTKQNKLQSF